MQAVSLFGEVQGPTRTQALDAMRRRLAVYRARVQQGLLDGRGMDGAHADARPLLVEVRGYLTAAGMSAGEAEDAIAREFHA